MNHIDPEHIESFEAYLEGDLTTEERLIFEHRLDAEPDLKASFSSYKQLNKALPDAFERKLREQLQQTDAAMPPVARTPVKNIRPKRLYWAVGIAAVFIGLIIGVYQLRSENRIFDTYWQPEPGLPVTMSEERSWNPAMNAFKQRNWDEAETHLMELTSDTASYFLGVVAYEQGEILQAIQWFDSVPENSVWYSKSQYRKALLFLKRNERERAAMILEQIPEIRASSSLPVSALLKEIKK